MGTARVPPANGAILVTIERLLETRSLEELRVADILREAGVSRAAFYGVYANKAAAVAALVRQGLDAAQPLTEKAFAAKGLKPDVLVESLRSAFEALYPHRALILAALDGRLRYPELAELHREALARFSRQLPAEPPLAAAFLCVAESALVGYLSGASELKDAKKIAEALVAMYVGATQRPRRAPARKPKRQTSR